MLSPSARAGALLFALAACTDPATNQPGNDKPTATAPPAAAAPVAPVAPVAPAGPLTTQYAGEYNWGDTTRQDAGGTLTVYPESDSTVLFYLDVSAGPPAFHVGQLYQRAVVRGGVAQCAFKEDYDEKGCRLTINFRPQAAVVSTVEGYGECGFGQGVYADETYRRTSSAVPQQFEEGAGRAVKFRETTPEQYNGR
jgi:hypothetical protein